MAKTEDVIRARKQAAEWASDEVIARHGQLFLNHLDVGLYLRDLTKRINHPHLINQGKTDFCGPAAVLHAMAKDNPHAYARLGVELLLHGHSQMQGGGAVHVRFLKDQMPAEDLEIAVCDWVMMSALRQGMPFAFASSLGIKGALPMEVESSLRSLGYRTVHNVTHASAFSRPGIDNLKAAADLLGRGFRVILCVNSDMFSANPTPSLKPNHFCTLRSVLQIPNQIRTGDRIKIRVWQWGKDKKEHPNSPKIFVDLPANLFMENYFGYVAGGDLVNPQSAAAAPAAAIPVPAAAQSARPSVQM